MGKLKLYLYPEATPHNMDTREVPEYTNTVPLSAKGIEEWVELVPPEQADFFYLGQFHYEDTLRSGFQLERFPFLEKVPEKHIADIEGDWEHSKFHPIFWKCILTMNSHSRDLAKKNANIFVRSLNSRLLMSLRKREDIHPFLEERKQFGFRGNLMNHWIRILLLGYFKKWGIPFNCIHLAHGFGATHPDSPEVRDYEQFMLANGLALCPRGVGNCSVRFYEACFYSCVPIIIGDHGVLGEDVFDTSFFFQITPYADEERLHTFFNFIHCRPLEELIERGKSAREYFDTVVRCYYQDPTRFFLDWLKRKRLWREE